VTKLPVHFTKRATRQIEEAHSWWLANRPDAPHAIAEELERVIGLLALQPGAGAPARAPRLRGVRRVLIARIDYYAYYRVRPRLRRVEVFAFWHARRGSEPPP
jgi:hypothetical protein